MFKQPLLRYQRGYTFIEVMYSIAIIAIGTIAYAYYQLSATQKLKYTHQNNVLYSSAKSLEVLHYNEIIPLPTSFTFKQGHQNIKATYQSSGQWLIQGENNQTLIYTY